MSSNLSPDTMVKPETVPTTDQDTGQPLPDPEKLEGPKKRVTVRGNTILNEGTRGQDSRYPPDRMGEAAGENGRVWKIYKDRVKDIDDDLLEGWNDTLNMLLVFAGLFSATCTAFLIEVSKNLQPDWQRTTSIAVFAIYVHLNTTNPVPFDVPNPLSFAATSDARWINGLWFTSLTLSLVASSLAILAKQRLNEYKSRMRAPASSPKMWAMRHSVFKGGLERWGVDAFISTLPVLLHAALFFFLAGLCLLLLPLNDYIAGVVMAITGVVELFYILASFAPMFWGDCPSATPLLRYLYSSCGRMLKATIQAAIFGLYTTVWLLRTVILLLIYLVLAIGELFYSAVFGTSFSSDDTPIGKLFTHIVDAVDSLFRIDIPLTTAQTVGPSSSAPIGATSPPVRAVLRYRPKTTVVPAFDQAKVLADDEPLREASVIAWMIRMLPAEDDIQVALHAAGWLSASAHFEYFQVRRRDSPLVHEDLRRAAVDALDNIAARDEGCDNASVASILRACLFVAEGPLHLSEPTTQFLSKYADDDAHQLRLLSMAAIYNGNDLPLSATSQPLGLRAGSADLIALSGSRGKPYPRGVARLIITASDTVPQSYTEDYVSTLESDILTDEACSLTGWKPRVKDDLRLRFLAALDIGLQYSNSSMIYDWERHTIAALYGGVVRDLAYDYTVDLSRGPSPLGLLATTGFQSYDFSVDDLNAIGTLLMRVTSDGRSGTLPVTLFALLNHFEHRSLAIEPETVHRIKVAFKLPSDPIQLVHGLRQHQSARMALTNSHLSLLARYHVSPQLSRSPWNQLVNTLPVAITAEELADMACAYSVLLLVLHRRGYGPTAQALLRELLPVDIAVTLISQETVQRYHLALHAKVVLSSLWIDMRERLLDPTLAWVPCNRFADVEAFIATISAQQDCVHCAHDEISFHWGTAPRVPDAIEIGAELDVTDPEVWDPLEPTLLSEKAPWYTSMTRAARRLFWIPRGARSSSDSGQPEGRLESGLLQAFGLGAAFAG